MKIDIEAIKAGQAESDDQTTDANVDYDLVVKQFATWIDDQPADQPPSLNTIRTKLREWILASDGADLVRDRIVALLVKRWPDDLKPNSLKAEWRFIIEEINEVAPEDEPESGIDPRFLATADINFDEPASSPVDGPQLFADIVGALVNHDLVYFHQPEQAEAVALWIMSSRFMDSWSHFPHLTVTAPTPESGKSALVTMTSALTPLSKQFGRVTPASIRNIYAEIPPTDEDGRPQHLTVTVDEMDSVPDGEAATLVMDMKLAFDRKNATTTKNIPDDTSPTGMRVVTIPIWGPKLMAGIGLDWIDAPLKSRAVVIHMQPKPVDMVIPEIPHDIDKRFAHIRSRLVRFGFDNALSVPNAEIPDWLSAGGRLRNAWGPMIRVAAVLGGDHPAKARRGFEALNASHALDASIMSLAEQALRDTHAVMSAKRKPSHARRGARGAGGEVVGMEPAELAKELVRLEDRPWADMSGGRGLSTKKLADLLGKFNVRSRGTKNDNGKVVRVYQRADIEAAAKPLLSRWKDDG